MTSVNFLYSLTIFSLLFLLRAEILAHAKENKFNPVKGEVEGCLITFHNGLPSLLRQVHAIENFHFSDQLAEIIKLVAADHAEVGEFFLEGRPDAVTIAARRI